MFNFVRKNKIKIHSRHDLVVAKEVLRYEVKLREQALSTGISSFGTSLKEAAKSTLKDITTKLIMVGLVKLLTKREK